jgi:alkylation response protein AidB-like acyl-CoA dehydrogenase
VTGAEPITGVQARAREISELARELAGETERNRRLADRLVARLRSSGLMVAGAPREVAGLELAPALTLRCAEEIARGDASAGWCVSIAATSSLLAAYLPEASRSELFCDAQRIAAGIFAPRGTGRAVDGGLLVSGRWPYCSGISDAEVLFAGCFVDGAAVREGGRRLPSVVAMPRDQLEILDTWHTLGLRGTGSHDAVAEQLFVPSAR